MSGSHPATRFVVALLSGLGLVLLPGLFVIGRGGLGYDAWAYAHVDLADPYRYGSDLDSLGAFRYAPPLAILFSIAGGLVPWPAFLVPWMGLLLAAVVYLGRRGYSLALLGVPFVALDLFYGNVDLLIAVAIAAGRRWPAAWAVVLLAKPSCGVALLWHLARRAPRPVFVAAGVTLLVALPTAVWRPDLWTGWAALLAANLAVPQPVPLLPRLVVAAGVAVVGGRRGWAWAIPVAATIGVPSLGLNQLSILAALVPFLAGREARRWPWERPSTGVRA